MAIGTAKNKTYHIRPGDCLKVIAREHGVWISDMIRENPELRDVRRPDGRYVLTSIPSLKIPQVAKTRSFVQQVSRYAASAPAFVTQYVYHDFEHYKHHTVRIAPNEAVPFEWWGESAEIVGYYADIESGELFTLQREGKPDLISVQWSDFELISDTD